MRAAAAAGAPTTAAAAAPRRVQQQAGPTCCLGFAAGACCKPGRALQTVRSVKNSAVRSRCKVAPLRIGAHVCFRGGSSTCTGLHVAPLPERFLASESPCPRTLATDHSLTPWQVGVLLPRRPHALHHHQYPGGGLQVSNWLQRLVARTVLSFLFRLVRCILHSRALVRCCCFLMRRDARARPRMLSLTSQQRSRIWPANALPCVPSCLPPRMHPLPRPCRGATPRPRRSAPAWAWAWVRWGSTTCPPHAPHTGPSPGATPRPRPLAPASWTWAWAQ